MTATVPSPASLWLVEDDVRSLVSLNDTIDALDDGLRREARGEAANIDKALGQWDGGTVHALGSMMPSHGYTGIKTWANTPNGAAAIFSLFSTRDGRLLAIMEAGALGSMRTAAISGLAARQFAVPGVNELSIIGTGNQASMQIAAIGAVLPLKRVRVFSPTPEKRRAFIARARGMFEYDIVETHSVEEAVEGSALVTLITRAKEPFLSASKIARGAHINAPGAILPAFAELDQDVFARASLIAVDSKSNAAKSSRELIEQFGNDMAQWDKVRTLGECLNEGLVRPADADITLFKSMGMGLSDLTVAALAYERACKENVGTQLPLGNRAPPRWTAFKGFGTVAHEANGVTEVAAVQSVAM